MSLKKLLALIALIAFTSSRALAVPVEVGTLSGVHIGSALYDVVFFQEELGQTSFNDVFGRGPVGFTFTTAEDALAAAAVVRDVGSAASLSFNPLASPAPNPPAPNGFALPFSADLSGIEYVTGFNGEFDGVFGPFSADRESPLFVSFATFKKVSAPEPSTTMLFGLGLMILALARRPLKR